MAPRPGASASLVISQDKHQSGLVPTFSVQQAQCSIRATLVEQIFFLNFFFMHRKFSPSGSLARWSTDTARLSTAVVPNEAPMTPRHMQVDANGNT